jgi:putative ABC transport system permease protein
MRDWLSTPRRTVDLHIPPPQRLESLMKAKGVAVTPQEAAAGRLQTRWVLGLALGVAFVGILNAMLMSVTERFREIGTMKCLGALDGFIVKLFLIESVFQGVVGTLIGVTLGLALSMISAAVSFGQFAWLNVPVSRIAISVVWCVLVGVGLTVAGAVYPAWQAARMQPIEAMRVDT